MAKFVGAIIALLATAFLGAVSAYDLFASWMARLRNRGPVGIFLADLIVSPGLRVFLFIVAVILIIWGIRENRKLRQHIDPQKLAELEGKQWHETARYDLTEGKAEQRIPISPAEPKHELQTRPLAPSALSDASKKTLLTATQSQGKVNLIFKKPEHPFIHLNYGMLQEGHKYDSPSPDPDFFGTILPIENEFSDQFRAIPVSDVTAQLSYDCATEESFRVNRGAWLEGGNVIGFPVNKVRRLIVAAVIPGKKPLTVAIYKEYSDDPDHFERIVRILDDDYYLVTVKLISEELGRVYLERQFDLEITRDPVSIELTPHTELSAEQIRQKLEGFLQDGNNLLGRFPKDRELTLADENELIKFETQATRFIARCSDRFSIAVFLSDVPVVKYDGLAHANNWPYLNRLTTRIARLRDMVEEMRRS